MINKVYNKNILLQIILFLTIISSKVLGTSGLQEEQIEQDIHIMQRGLSMHEGDPCQCDSVYGEIGDRLIAFAKGHIPTSQEKNYNLICSLYLKDKEDNLVNPLRLTWLTLQLSMVLQDTVGEARNPAIDNIARVLNCSYEGRPLFLIPFGKSEILERSGFYGVIKDCHKFAIPLTVYQGKGAFSTRAYLNAASKGFFLIALDPLNEKGHFVHGGLFTNAAQKNFHDLTHYYNQWKENTGITIGHPMFAKNENQIRKYVRAAKIWKRFAGVICEELDSNVNLTSLEKDYLEVFSFSMMHETGQNLPVLINSIQKESLVEVARNLAWQWYTAMMPVLSKPDEEEAFYKSIYKDETVKKEGNILRFNKISSIKKSEEDPFYTGITCVFKNNRKLSIQNYEPKGESNYIYWKTFYRDLGYLLKSKGLWKYETQKLGITYPMAEIKETMDLIYQWFLKNIEDNGKLYPALGKVKLGNS